MAARLLAVIAYCLAVSAAGAEVLRGEVVGISDGDTLTALVDRKPVKVRLAEIDAPESRQPFGARSKLSLSALCYRQAAEIETQSRDRYGRTVGHVTCAGTDAQVHQVREGMAWVFDRYVTDRALYSLQDEARGARRGLWADPNPVPPWAWRRSTKAKQ